MRILAFAGLAALALGVSACDTMNKPAPTAAPPAGPTAELVVVDQTVVRGTVTIDKIMMAQDGWVVIHEMSADGKPVAPGSIGHTAVKAGTANEVAVRLTKRVRKGAKLMAMLHVDTGKMGVYEFSRRSQTEDKPLMIGNAPVVKVFNIQ
jgi:hypothetical protein